MADADRKMLVAESAASKAKVLSTVTSKLREADRYADLQTKHLGDVAKIEKRIAEEQKKLGVAQVQMEREEAKSQR